MSLLSIVQEACARIGITPPGSVVSSTDPQVLQLLVLANTEGRKLSTGTSVGLSYDWQALEVEASFTSVAAESQGLITTIAPGYKYIINDTIWNRSQRLQAMGALTAQQWQNYKSWMTNSPYPKYRVRGGRLLLLPIPTAGESYYFEYQSANWCTNAAGTLGKTSFTSDYDVSLLDEQLITDGLVWRWKQAKGYDYAEDFVTYQNSVMIAIARDKARETLDLGGCGPISGIVVPIGSWNV